MCLVYLQVGLFSSYSLFTDGVKKVLVVCEMQQPLLKNYENGIFFTLKNALWYIISITFMANIHSLTNK